MINNNKDIYIILNVKTTFHMDYKKIKKEINNKIVDINILNKLKLWIKI